MLQIFGRQLLLPSERVKFRAHYDNKSVVSMHRRACISSPWLSYMLKKKCIIYDMATYVQFLIRIKIYDIWLLMYNFLIRIKIYDIWLLMYNFLIRIKICDIWLLMFKFWYQGKFKTWLQLITSFLKKYS